MVVYTALRAHLMFSYVLAVKTSQCPTVIEATMEAFVCVQRRAREALMDGDNQWQEPGFVCAVIPTITAAPSHRNSREEVAQCGGGNWWCQTRFVWM